MSQPARLFLIGYRGAGKSTVARLLAERLANEVISLPMCPGQTAAQTEYVIEKVLDLA